MRNAFGWRKCVATVFATWLVSIGFRADAAPVEDELATLDLEALMELEVTTASKRSQRAFHTPAAVFVITQEDIRRSGVTSIPEALRLAPGVHVSRVDASRWAVSVRGFNNEFSNKLLVMIDGRSVYAHTFSGVFWNEHDLMLEDIDRIEVVRGPGGTVWGANAVNGVIHVITKSAADTQGLVVSSRAGEYETFTGAARYGGSVGEGVHYRVYGKFSDHADFPDSNVAGDAHDAWDDVRVGARLDWEAGENGLLTLQGDVSDLDADRLLTGGLRDDEEKTSGNVLTRYTHRFSDTSEASLQAYYHHIERESTIFDERTNTWDLDFQHTFMPIVRNQFVWGAGYRVNDDHHRNNPITSYQDTERTDQLVSLFAQDEIAVVEDLLWLTVGTKLEHNDYTGWEVQPSGRVLLTPHERHALWAAVSRAVRTPSRVEHEIDIVAPQGPIFLRLRANDDYDSEEVVAYEAGYRTTPVDSVNLDVAAYYNEYDDLRSAEITGGAPPVLLGTFGNEIEGFGWGVEVAAHWAVTDTLRLTGAYTHSRTDLTAKTGSTDTTTVAEGEDLAPRNQFRIGSRLNLPWNVDFDASVSWVERLPGTEVDAYTRLDLRLAWEPIQNLELAVAGLNLIEEHQEWPDRFPTQPSDIPRSVYGSVRWQY